MRRGYDDLILMFFKLCLLIVLVVQCIPAYPYRVDRNEKRAGQFSSTLNNSEGSPTHSGLREFIDETAESIKQSNLEKRLRRNVSGYEDTLRSSSHTTAQSDIKFVFPEELNVVPACKGSTYCETVNSYPEDAVNRAIRRNESIKYLEGVDVIDVSPLEERIGQTDDIPLCMSIEHVVFPQSAKNKDNEWKFVANQDNFKQGVRIERCRKENASCSAIGSLAEGYKTNCRQKYVYRQLASVMTDGTVVPDTFRFPSSCCCHVSFNGNLLTRMGVNIVDQRSQFTPIKTRKRK